MKNRKKMSKENIVFYQDWFEAILEIPVEKQLQEFLNIFNYGYYNIVPASKSDDFGFKTIMYAIDRNSKRHAERCKANKQNAEKRWAEENAKNAAIENGKQKTVVYIKDAKDANDTKNAKNANDAKHADNDNERENEKKTDSKKSNAIFTAYQSWLKENSVYCGNPDKFKQLTENELWQLASKYSVERIKDAILNLEKKKSVRKKYAELYKVLSDGLEKMNIAF